MRRRNAGVFHGFHIVDADRICYPGPAFLIVHERSLPRVVHAHPEDENRRAIDHTTAGGDLKHLLTGVEAVHTQLLGVLGKEGVTVIDPMGEHFDPMTQQAVSQTEDPDVPEGTVVDVFQKGYALGGRVIRSAMVVVSTGGPQAQE